MKRKWKYTTIFLYLLFFSVNCLGGVNRTMLDPQSLVGFILSIDPFKIFPPPKSIITISGVVSSLQEGQSATLGIFLQNDPYGQVIVHCETDYPSLLVNGVRNTDFFFDSVNFSNQQTLVLSTVVDGDNISDSATLKCTASGLANSITNIFVNDNYGILLTGTVPTLLEGNTVTIGASLSVQPFANVSVNVTLNNSAVTINGSNTLTLNFTPADYNVTQNITILAVIDGNSTDDPTTLTFQMIGIPDLTYNLTVIDDNVIQVTGPPSSINEGLSTTMGIRYFKPLLTNNSITITSSNPAAITVNGGASATFNYTPANATTDQIVTLAALIDVNLVPEIVTLTLTTTGMAPLTLTVTTVDVDTQNLVVTGAIPTLVENTSGVIQVHLTNMPPSPVVVNIITSNGTSLGVSPSTLNFTAGNYNIDQAVTVSALNDANETSENLTVILTSPDAPMQVYNVTTIDDDTRILISGATSVNENGSSVVTVSLSGDPGIARTINLTSSDLLAMTLSTPSLAFSPGNYTQSMTVNGVQDANIVNETVVFSANGAGLISATTNISIIDDDTMNILLTAGSNLVTEGGTTTFNLRLTQEPSPSLTVNLSSSIAGSVSLSAASFTFDNVCPGPNCWSTNQIITVNGLEDINETSETSIITASAAAVTTVAQNYTTIENDTKPVFGGATSVSESGTALVTVSLSGDPGANRTLNLSSSNILAMTLAPTSISFNSANWNIPQTVLVSGVSDANIISEAVTITGSGVSLVTDTVVVNTVDINTMSVILSGNPGTINEGGTATFNVRLTQDPSGPFTVNLASGTVGSVTLSTAILNFTSANYNVDQVVTITGVEDVNETSETVTITATSLAPTVTFDIDTVENDSRPVFTGATSVTENGVAFLNVALSGNPNGTRTLNIVSSNPLAVGALPATLTFNASNWNVPQSVLLSGIPDANVVSEVVTITGSGIDLTTDTTNITANDINTMSVILSGNPATINEGGTATFNVRLTQDPSGPFTVNLTSGTVGSVTLSTASLNFTSANYNVDQVVTLTGVEDVNETSETVTITATSTAPTVTFNIDTVENDSRPVFTGATSVTEGSTALVSVALSGNPNGTRTLSLVSSDTAAVTLSPATLTFNASNWNIPQAVLITGVSDANTSVETVTITGSGVDLTTDSVSVATIDSTVISIILTASGTTVPEGGTSTLDVQLSAPPAAPLTVTIVSNTTGSVTVGPASLIFTAANYNVNQTVTLTGVEDVNESSEVVTISATAPLVTGASVDYDTIENDTRPVFAGATSVTENGVAFLTVALSGNPGTARTLNIASSDVLAVNALPATLSFNTTNWNIPQSVLLSGTPDANVISEVVTITGSGVGLVSDTTSITANDINTMSVILSGNPTTVNEGGTATFNVRLAQDPSGPFTVNLASGTVGSVTLSTASVNFTSANYNIDQVVTLTGVEDVNETSETVTITATSTAPTVTFDIDTVENDSRPVFTGATSVTENGVAFLNVALSGNPNGTRTLNIVSSNPLAVGALPATLTFNASNWNVPQSVLLSGIPDANVVSEAVTITGSGIDLTTDTTSITANDINTMSVILSGNPTTVNEGGTATFNVRLTQDPSGPFTVNLASGTVGSVTLSTASVNFTSANYNVDQVVTLTGVEDVNETSETVTISATSTAPTVTFDIDTVENDARPVFTGATSVTEGSTALVSVALSGNPNGTRILNLVSSDTAAVTLSPATLTFNASNWNVPQSVTIAGVSDANILPEAVTITGSGVDLTTDTVVVNTVDINTMSVILSGNPATINEGGTATFNVRLTQDPSGPFTVNLASGTVGSVTLSTASVNFTSANYNIDQVVTLTGVEDVNETSETVTITATSTAPTVTFDIATVENDSRPVFTGATSVTEGSTALVSVALSGNPNGTRTLNLVSSDTAAVTLSPATLTFNASNWNIPQAVLITGVSDANTSVETVTITGSGVDLTTDSVSVATIDSTVISIILTASGTTVPEGGTSTLDVQLSAPPAAPLTVTIVSNTTGSVTVGPASLIFTAANYNVNQTVTLTGVEDVNESSEVVTISATAPLVTGASVNYDTIENDTRPVFAGATSVTENGVAFLTVALSGNPGTARTLNIASSDVLAVNALPATLSFNTTNWNIPQSVLLSGTPDANVISEVVTITGSGVGLVSDTTSITANDINTMSVILSGNPATINEGGTATFNVRLTQDPSGPFTVNLASGTVGSVTLSTASVNFTSANYNVDQVVTLTGVEDVNETSETVTITATSTAPTVTFDIETVENDARPVFTGATSVTEGSTALVSVALSGNPNGTRILNLVSSDTAAVTLSPATLTFNASNWNVPQSVTIAGVSDANILPEAVTITGSGVDLTTDTVVVNTVDINTMSVILSGNPTTINEGGTATFNVRLTQDPSGPFTVNLASGAIGSVTLSTASVNFTSANYNIDQVVTLTGVEDVNETSETVTITATSTAPTVTFDIATVENDSRPVFTGATSVTEGSTALVSVALSGNPNGTRILNLVSSDTAAVTLSPATLTFNASNWNIPQAVLITGVTDANTSVETVTITGSGVDLTTDTVNVTTIDSTVTGIILTASGTTVPEGGTSTLDVQLSAPPAAPLTVTIVSNTIGAVTVGPASLIFTAANYNVNQTVTLTGVEDVNESSEVVTISATAPLVTGASVDYDTVENDTRPVFAGATSVTENGVAFLTVALSGNPGTARTLNIASSDVLAVNALPATLSFNTTNWNIPQSVLLSGTPDANVISEVVTITGSGVGLVSDTTSITANDINTMSVILSGNPATINEGGTATFNVRLTQDPSGPFTVNLASGTVGSVTLSTASVNFTSANYNVDQVVTLTGVEDVNETSETVTITATSTARL
ncbi:MAG: hypothetical protein IPL26_11105 [Leptospiraceae bacterium]|nr:hypothetical protein [Leptospiraceae bacterium]